MQRYTVSLMLLLAVLISCQNGQKESTQKRTNEELQLGDTVVLMPIDGIDVDYLMGHFEPSSHADFIEVDKMYADRAGLYLRKETYKAFRDMHEAAINDSVNLVIRSAARNFDYQKGIWERKWTGQTKLEGKYDARSIDDPGERALAILRWSSMPGTSRHHWGTDLDVNAFENSYFEQGEGLRVYTWLCEHALDYGFGQPYTAKDSLRPNGYNEEKWHWSYLPIGIPLTRLAEDSLSNDDILGFMGADIAPQINVVENYVLGIDANLK